MTARIRIIRSIAPPSFQHTSIASILSRSVQRECHSLSLLRSLLTGRLCAKRSIRKSIFARRRKVPQRRKQVGTLIALPLVDSVGRAFVYLFDSDVSRTCNVFTKPLQIKFPVRNTGRYSNVRAQSHYGSGDCCIHTSSWVSRWAPSQHFIRADCRSPPTRSRCSGCDGQASHSGNQVQRE